MCYEHRKSCDDKLSLAIGIIEEPNSRCLDFNHIYSSTTENIRGYSHNFDFDRKTYCTIGSSCDQSLDAISLGSKSIDIIDTCPFTEEYYYLKMAAILVLSREEYICFFSRFFGNRLNQTIPNSFSISTYEKLRDTIQRPCVREFWDYLYNTYGGTTIRSRLFSRQDSPSFFLPKAVNYLSSDTEYEKLRSLIRDAIVTFTVGDIFTTKIDKKYDNIKLSNLITYCTPEQIIQLCQRLSDNLNDGGTLLIGYLHGGVDCDIKHIRFEKLAKTLFDGVNVDNFTSCGTFLHGWHSFGNDAALIYKKTKKK